MKKFKRTLITAALPYANGPIHIGHLAGVYVPADIYARYLRLKGEDVLYICGSDEHGVPITLRARKEGKNPQEIVDYYHNLNKKSFEEFGISFDIYSRTTEKIHYETATEFFLKLYNKGVFIEKETEQFYDPKAKIFLADRYITGTCPHCGYEHAYGDQCEKCGTSLSPTELINPLSAITGEKPILKKTKHWYLPLDKFQDFLEKWILEEHKDWKPNVLRQVKAWFDMGLKPRAVTRDLDWGVPVPLEEAKGKVLYVWFDAPIGYISATKQLTDEWEKYWKDPETRLIHFIGKDNIVFHCIIFPAMLKAEGSYILPDNVPANEFLNLEGDKFSTSKNWAIWLPDYLKDFPDGQDALRYVLTINMPEQKDNNFTWKEFQTRVNNELVGDYGNFVYRVVSLINRYYDGKIPSPEKLLDEQKELLQKILVYKEKVEKALDKFKFKEAILNAINIAREGNKYLSNEEPWKWQKIDPKRTETILYIAAQFVANLAIITEPFLPFAAAKLKKMLDIGDKNWNDISTELLKPGHKINKAEILFAKIPDEKIQEQLQKLQANKKQTQSTEYKPLKPQITYEDFDKLDIRIGTIEKAEKVPKTDKLLKLTVDLGFEKRTLVGGIAQYYTPEEAIGKKVVILANLKPRKIRGIVSQGMLLMAENPDGKLSFLMPEKDIDNGSTVS